MKEINRRFWHYTPAIRLYRILESGKIKLDEQAKFYGEKPAAWVSTNPLWENTATKPILDVCGVKVDLTLEEMYLRLGLGRIEIQPSRDFISWYKFRKTSGVNPKIWNGMTKYGLKVGADPNEWFASYSPILSRYFISVEMFIKDKWVKCEDWSKIKQFVSEGMKVNNSPISRPDLKTRFNKAA